MDMTAFYTRDKANEGARLPLSLPDGTKTDDYLIVRGVDSDHFRDADAKAKREIVQAAAIKDEAAKAERLREIRTDVLVALVAGWSLADAFTPENVRALLSEAPQIADAVDTFAARRALFFGIGSNSLPSGANASSSSAASRKGRKTP
jgi:hypothetical protein